MRWTICLSRVRRDRRIDKGQAFPSLLDSSISSCGQVAQATVVWANPWIQPKDLRLRKSVEANHGFSLDRSSRPWLACVFRTSERSREAIVSDAS